MIQISALQNDVEVVQNVISVPRDSIRPFPDQPRQFFDQQELQELASSIEVFGQNVPAFVRELDENDGDSHHRYELVNGQRRWHALQIAGVTKMKVIVLEIKDIEEQFLISVLSNFGMAKHGPMEIVNAVMRFKNNGMTVSKIAKVFARCEGWVYQHLKIAEKLHPEVQKMMSQKIPEDDRLTFSVALIVADVPQDLQPKIAHTILSEKLKMMQAKDYIRRQGKQHGFSVGNPERTPRKDYQLLSNFTAKLNRDLGVFTQLPQEFFEKMFEFREEGDHDQMLLAMEQNIKDLRKLVAVVKQAKKEKV